MNKSKTCHKNSTDQEYFIGDNAEKASFKKINSCDTA